MLELAQPSASGSFADSAPLTEADAAEIAGNRRFMIVNAWRSTSREAPVRTQPLAVLDCATLAADDLFKIELVFTDRVGQNLGA